MKQLVLYIDRLKAVLQTLTNEQAGMLLNRLIRYIDGNDCEAGNSLVDAMFLVLKVDIDTAVERYDEICRKRSEAGKRHKGNQYTKQKEQNETNETSVPNLEQVEQMGLIKEKKIKENKIINKPSKEGSLSFDNPHEEVDYEKLVSYWNNQVEEHGAIMNKITNIRSKRKISVLARMKEYGKDALKIVIDKAVTSDFLNGKNDRAWTANFDWIFQHPNNFLKVYEGNYDNKQPADTNIGIHTNSGKTASERVDEALGLLDNL